MYAGNMTNFEFAFLDNQDGSTFTNGIEIL